MFLQKAMRYYRLWIYSCNLALLLSVMVFVALSAWILSDPKMSLIRSITFYHPTFIYAYFALAFQGGILQAIGCIGALRMHERLLNAYWMAMLILLVGDAIVGVAWIFHYHHLTTNLRSDLKLRLQTDYGTDIQFQLLWDRIQMDSGCCGVDSPQDYNASAWKVQQRRDNPQHNQVVPRSCCQMHQDPIRIGEVVPINYSCVETYVGELIHQQGCYDTVRWWLQHSADILSVLGFCVIAFLKVCFLGILRYEIREMIQKIQILKTMSEPPPLLGALETNIPKATTSPNGAESRDTHIANCVTPQLSPDAQVIKDSHKPPNGNNNETDISDAVKKYSAV